MIAHLAGSAIFNLRQINEVISQTGHLEYASSLSVLFGSSIGMHVRHIIEFYQCLLEGSKSGTVNYDARKRDLLIETDVHHATTNICDCIVGIEDLETNEELLLLTSTEESDIRPLS